VPNMDPWIRPFATLSETPRRCSEDWLRRDHAQAFRVPYAGDAGWETDTFESWSGRTSMTRGTAALLRCGDNQIAAWGTVPAQLASLDRDGQIAASGLPGLRKYDRGQRMSDAPHRPGNTMLWMAEYPERMAR